MLSMAKQIALHEVILHQTEEFVQLKLVGRHKQVKDVATSRCHLLPVDITSVEKVQDGAESARRSQTR